MRFPFGPAVAASVFALSLSAVPCAGAVAPPATTATLPLGFQLRTCELSAASISRMEEHPLNRDLYVIGLFTPLTRLDVHGAEITTQSETNVRALGQTFNSYASGIDFDAAGNVYVSSHNGQILKGIYDANTETFSGWSLINNLETQIDVIGEHGFGGLAIDRAAGKLYINAGSINPGDDPANPEPDYDLNARILRMDLTGSGLEVFARGIRNHFGITVRSNGEVFGLENATCDYAEEFNQITAGSHLGYPFRAASDRSGSDAGLYPCDEADPGNIDFTAAWGNLGPDGVPSEGQPGYVDGGIYYGFNPHSTPTGIDFYDTADMDADATLFPPDYHGRAFVTRFGTQLPDNTPAGYDLLSLGLVEQDRHFSSNAFLTGLFNPLDVVCATSGKVYVLEFHQLGDGPPGPGRVLEISYQNMNAPASYLAKQQKLQVGVDALGAQLLNYRFANGAASVSPYQAVSGAIPYFPVQGEFVGLYLYDYDSGQFNQAVYPKFDWLPGVPLQF